MGRGSAVVFGKITLSSEADSIKTLVDVLDAILSNYGYPADDYGKKEDAEDSAPFAKEKEAKEEEKVKAIISKAKPAEDSIILLQKEAEDAELEEELEDELDDLDGEEEDALGRPDDAA